MYGYVYRPAGHIRVNLSPLLYRGAAALECGTRSAAVAGRGAAGVRSAHSQSGALAPHSKERLLVLGERPEPTDAAFGRLRLTRRRQA